jgi:hypothetical protein
MSMSITSILIFWIFPQLVFAELVKIRMQADKSGLATKEPSTPLQIFGEMKVSLENSHIYKIVVRLVI